MFQDARTNSPGLKLSYLGAALVLTLLLQINISLQNPVPDYDEAVYLDLARSVSTQGVPVRTSSGRLYAVHPPGYFYPAGVFYHAGLKDVILQRSLQTALSLVLLGIVYGISRRVWSEGAARWAVLLLAINPFFLRYAHSVYLELPETLWLFASLACWLWAERGGAACWERYLLAGVALGLAALTKYFAVSLGVAYLLYYAIQQRGRFWRSRPFWLIFGSSALLFALWPVYAWALLGTEELRAAWAARAWRFLTPLPSDPRTLTSLKDLLVKLATAPGPLVALPMAVAFLAEARWAVVRRAWRDPKPERRFRILVLIWIIVLTGLLLSLPVRDQKYFYPLLPAGLMLLAAWGVQAFAALKRDRTSRPTVLAVLALGVWVVLIFPVDLTGIDHVPVLQKLYFTGHDYTWRASPHHIALPGMSERIVALAKPGERILVGRAGPIVCYYTGLPYRMTYLAPSLEQAERLLDEHRIFLIDGPPEVLFPNLTPAERARLGARVMREWLEVARDEETRLLLKLN